TPCLLFSRPDESASSKAMASTGRALGAGPIRKQIPQSSRRNPLPVKRINGSLLMGHEHVARALIELMQSRKTSSGTDHVLHHAPKAFDGVEVVPTMGR